MSFKVPASSTVPSVHQTVLMGTIHRYQTAPTKDSMAITSLPVQVYCLLKALVRRHFMTVPIHERQKSNDGLIWMLLIHNDTY